MNDKIPIAATFNPSLAFEMVRTDAHRYMLLLERIERGAIDPSFTIAYRMRLYDAPEGYRSFRNKQDDRVKVTLASS